MTKRLLSLAAALLCVCALCSCSQSKQVEELLSAPALTDEQSDIIEAINSLSSEAVTLKYPKTGERRAPIIFLDLDSDGETEALAFYNVAAEGVYARIALLEKEGGEWAVADTVDGLGTDVDSVSSLTAGEGERVLLVGWMSVNQREQTLATYHFSGGRINLGLEENCEDTILYDFDADGNRELCYIMRDADGFYLKYIYELGREDITASSRRLSDSMMGVVSVAAGEGEDGASLVFVDELVTEDMMMTEVFEVNGDRLDPVSLAEGLSIPELTLRPLAGLACMRPYEKSSIEIPTVTPPFGDVAAPESWCYWYNTSLSEFVYTRAGYLCTDYDFVMCVPDAWLSFADVTVSEDDKQMFNVVDTVSGEIIFKMRVLFVGEDSAPLLEEGYSLLARSGSYRYYYQSTVSEEEIAEITAKFITL